MNVAQTGANYRDHSQIKHEQNDGTKRRLKTLILDYLLSTVIIHLVSLKPLLLLINAYSSGKFILSCHELIAVSFCMRYGDKAPKSIVARIFSIFWILLGLIIMAIFIANITSALTALSMQLEPTDLVGVKVCSNICGSYTI